MTDAQIIRDARNLLFERGWNQGALEGDDGSLCVSGAVNAAVNAACLGPVEPYFRVLRLFESVVSREITGWNDAPERTFNEVIDAMDRAEKIAESREVSS